MMSLKGRRLDMTKKARTAQQPIPPSGFSELGGKGEGKEPDLLHNRYPRALLFWPFSFCYTSLWAFGAEGNTCIEGVEFFFLLWAAGHRRLIWFVAGGLRTSVCALGIRKVFWMQL